MSKLAKGLFGVFVLAACAAGADDGPGSPTASVELALAAGVQLSVVAPPALPNGMGARLGKTCTTAFPPGVERMLFGAAGPPGEVKALQRVIPAAAPRELRAREGEIALEPKPQDVGRVATVRLADRATGSNVITSADGTLQVSPKLRGTNAVSALSSDGLVVYPGGHVDGDVVVRPRDDGVED